METSVSKKLINSITAHIIPSEEMQSYQSCYLNDTKHPEMMHTSIRALLDQWKTHLKAERVVELLNLTDKSYTPLELSKVSEKVNLNDSDHDAFLNYCVCIEKKRGTVIRCPKNHSLAEFLIIKS